MRSYRLRAIAVALILASCSATSPTTTTTTTTAPPTTTTSQAPATTVAATGDAPLGTDLAGAVFERTTIENFVAHTEVRLSNDPEGANTEISSVIDATYQRTPSAVEVDVSIDDRPPISIIGVEDRYFMNEGSGWEEQPLAKQLLSLASTSLLAPETVSLILPLLAEVGEEDIAGRPTVHYEGGPETLQVLINATDDPAFAEFTEIEYATVDLWVDKAGFMAKAVYEFGGIRAAATDAEYYAASFEITEYDGAVTITTPIP